MLEMYQSKTKQALLLGKFSKESFTFDQFLQFSILQWIVSNSGQKKNMVW
jgi:hypothetical protein